MNKGSNGKISLAHHYTLTIDKDNTVFLKVETEDDILEFDGKNGNLMDASDFESHFEETEMQMTLAECKIATYSFLKDWGVDEEAVTAIVEDLTPWFKEYAIEEPTADAWLKVLEDKVEMLRKQTETLEDKINKAIAEFKEWTANASDFDIYYGAEEHGKRVTSVREAYKASWEEFRKAEIELFRYRDTMHIR